MVLKGNQKKGLRPGSWVILIVRGWGDRQNQQRELTRETYEVQGKSGKCGILETQ